MTSNNQFTNPVDYGKATDYTPYPPEQSALTTGAVEPSALDILAERVAELTVTVLQQAERLTRIERGS